MCIMRKINKTVIHNCHTCSNSVTTAKQFVFKNQIHTVKRA